MDGLMMDFQLTLPAILRRAEQLFGSREIVSRRPDKSLHRYTYADMTRRAKQLAVALQQLGVQPGDRVATFAWNHSQHLEAYLGVPAFGGVLHTLNLRLHPDDLTYIMEHAGDRIVLVDDVLLPLFERVIPRVNLDHVVVMSEDGSAPAGMLSYEHLLASANPDDYREPGIDERQAAAMCYSSGTTGRPKGVVYSHRAIVLHSLACALPDVVDLQETDVVTPVVPMFHVNAWGLPFTATMLGTRQVYPGPHLDPASLAELFQTERVTITAGVPTIWLSLLQLLDRNPGAYDLSSMRFMLVGGQAAPEAMIRGFKERHGLDIRQGWGMTETTPVGTVSYVPAEQRDGGPDVHFHYLATAGRPLPFVEVRAMGESGIVPWDGQTMGELEVRGPWVASSYYDNPAAAGQFTEDGWFRTGDIASIDPLGYVEIKDRIKDVVKSGGEWISSVALENALMGHPAVAEAAVVAVPHPKWLERPVAVVVLKEGQTATEEELRSLLEAGFAKWWVPDAIVFAEAIPRTSTGKFLKSALRDDLRERFADRFAAETA